MGDRFEVRIGMQAHGRSYYLNDVVQLSYIVYPNYIKSYYISIYILYYIIFHYVILTHRTMFIVRQYSSPSVSESLKDLAESGVDNVGRHAFCCLRAWAQG